MNMNIFNIKIQSIPIFTMIIKYMNMMPEAKTNYKLQSLIFGSVFDPVEAKLEILFY